MLKPVTKSAMNRTVVPQWDRTEPGMAFCILVCASNRLPLQHKHSKQGKIVTRAPGIFPCLIKRNISTKWEWIKYWISLIGSHSIIIVTSCPITPICQTVILQEKEMKMQYEYVTFKVKMTINPSSTNTSHAPFSPAPNTQATSFLNHLF